MHDNYILHLRQSECSKQVDRFYMFVGYMLHHINKQQNTN